MIDLSDLGSLHPDLPDELVGAFQMYAAIALERQRHVSGVEFLVTVSNTLVNETIVWRKRKAKDASMLDMNRVTEDGAECLALLVVGQQCSWRAVRRLQSRLRQRADWLVEIPSGETLAFEVSGTESGPFERRIREKKAQAEAAAQAGGAAACVVRFLEPKAKLWSDHDPHTRSS